MTRPRPTILDTARAIGKATGRTPLTPRWEATLRAFYGLELRAVDVENLQASTRRSKASLRALSSTGRPLAELWARVGRRGRKSFVAALIGIHEACFGEHERYLLEGERGLVAIISKDTAGSVLVARFAELHAKALGIACNWSSMGAVRVLELEGIPLAIACFPCSAKSPRGWPIAVIVADEIAHWATDADEYENADSDVLGAVKPAMAQFPDSRLVAISSPLGREGMHYGTIEANIADECSPDLGEPIAAMCSDGVLAVEGPTWQWNPEITEARTHQLERDPVTHAREFGAVPADRVQANWFGSALDVAIVDEPPPPLPRGMSVVVAIDPAFAQDRFGWAVLSSQQGTELDARGRPRRVTYVHETGAWKPNGAKPSQLLARLKSEKLDRYTLDGWLPPVHSDQYEGHSLTELARAAGMTLLVVPWTAGNSETSKHARYTATRTAMLEGSLRIWRGETELIRELGKVRGIISASGHERIDTPRTRAGHLDRTAAFVLAASIALARSAQEQPKLPAPVDEMKAYKERLAAELGRRRRREWNRDPSGALRRALGMDRYR